MYHELFLLFTYSHSSHFVSYDTNNNRIEYFHQKRNMPLMQRQAGYSI